MWRLKRGPFPFILLLLLLLTMSSCRFFKKKKKEEPKEKPPVVEIEPSPSPLPAPRPLPSPQPLLTPPKLPIGTPNPMLRNPMVTPMAGLPPFPMGTPGPSEQIPHAESLATESQPLIDVKLGNPIKTAEGTTLTMDQAQVNYAGKAKLKFLWEVTSGPPDAIKVIDPQAVNTHVLIDNLDAPAQFSLRLTASDGKTEASGELMISAFPAKLEKIRRTGGAWNAVTHMGDKWVASRGNDLQIFGPDLNPLAQVKIDRTITQFFADEAAPGKGAIYIQTPEGNWTLLQADPVIGVKKTEIPSVGRTIRRVVPFVLDGAPYLFALLERSVELWNLSDPGHPRLKTTLGSFLKDPLYLTFAGRNIYVADEESIHLIDFSTGNLVASVPSGGSISSLATYSVDNKNFLLSSIDKDRTPQGRKDYGLRIFEIGADGRLGNEQRLQLKDNVPIKKATVIPGAAKALLSVAGAQGPELRLMDFKQMKEIPLELPKGFHFFALNGIETGKIQGNPVAVVADGNQLRVLTFKPQGEPASKFLVELKTSLPGMISAAWVQADPNGQFVWAGDEGSLGGGSVTLVDGQELNFLKNWEAPAGHFPAEADLGNSGEEGPLLYLGEDPSTLPPGEKEGELGLMEKKDPPNAVQEISKPFLGESSKQGILRPLGIKSRTMEGSLRIAVAIARISGSLGGSGVAILDKAAATKGFLAEDLAKNLQLIPLQDARDVALSADGKAAFIAGGTEGVIAVNLDTKQPVARMSLGSKDWLADRVVLGHGGNLLIASFIKPATRQGLIKIFGVGANLQMQEYGSIAGLPAIVTMEGLRAPIPALTQDDNFLFAATQARVFSVFNLSNPAAPAKIAEGESEGEIRGISIANKIKDVFLALGPSGVSKWQFGF